MKRTSSVFDTWKHQRFIRADSMVSLLLNRGKQAVAEQMREAEAFLEHLPDVEYAVTKINQRGRRQARILALRATEVENIKPPNVVTKSFKYGDVKAVLLDSHKVLRIKYTIDHDFVYESPVAPQITQELRTR